MAIAVLSALNAEIETLIDSANSLRRNDIGRWAVWTGSIHDREVILARAGLGKVNTAALAGIIWERHHVEMMLFTGVAGGLDPGLGIGDIVIGERTIQHDWGVITPDGLLRYQAGHFPFYNPTEAIGFTPTTRIIEAAKRLAPSVRLNPVLDRDPEIRFGTILTGDQFLQDEAVRDQLFAETGAQAIEMEGAALGQTAESLGIDHLVIRSLSDLAAGEAVEHFDEFVPQVSANSAKLVSALVKAL